MGEGDLAAIGALVVARLPIADANRLIDEAVRGHDAALESGEIDEGLEGGARLAQRLGRAVELALAVAAPAHHGAQRAVGRHGTEITPLYVLLLAGYPRPT